jgi:hypothetical protein
MSGGEKAEFTGLIQLIPNYPFTEEEIYAARDFTRMSITTLIGPDYFPGTPYTPEKKAWLEKFWPEFEHWHGYHDWLPENNPKGYLILLGPFLQP